jgi:RimJ/RimL family protein N-acetyltransferase
MGEKLTSAPTLETPRLRMRAHTLDDFPKIRGMWSDPDVTFHISGQPMIEEDIWIRFLRQVGHWSLLGYGSWLIEEKETGRYVGETGLFEAKRNMTPGFGDAHEAGWALAPWAHGKSYASEATQAAHAWHDKQFDRARTTCMIAPGNAPSLRVAEKLGYREFARTSYKGHDAILFER